MSDPVGFAIVGLGSWARVHADAARRTPNARVVNCYSRSAASRERFRAEFGLPQAAGSYDELLAADEVEVVVISTPNESHADLALRALAAGKSVLVDKPIGPDVADSLRILRAQSAAGAQCAVAHNARRLAGVRAAKRWVDSAHSGTIRTAHAMACNGNGRNISGRSWRATGKGATSGVLIQVGIHAIENLLYLLGPVRSVSAMASYSDVNGPVANTFSVLMQHASGAISDVQTCWTVPACYRMDLLGTEGSLHFDQDFSRWRTAEADHRNVLTARDANGPSDPPSVVLGDPLAEQLAELADSVRSGARVEIGPVEGLRAVAVVEAAVQSATLSGAAVLLDDVLTQAGASAAERALALDGD